MGATSLCGAICLVAANAAASAPGDGVSVVPSFSWRDVPDWLQLLFAAIGLGLGTRIMIGIVGVRDRLPEPDKDRAADFVKMLCDQVWGCSNRISTVFAQRLRTPPSDIVGLGILVRMLREDLSIPMNFVEQMRNQPADHWHGSNVFKAYTNWSAQVAAMSKQLDDLHQSITYPVLREPVDKQRDAMLVHRYHTEQAFLDRRVEELMGCAYQFCAVAREVLKKAKEKKGSTSDADAEDHDCPCCKRPPEQHRHHARDPLQPIVLPPAPVPVPPAPAPPAPAPAMCCCMPPRACQCRRGCGCACQCAPPPAKSG